MIRKNAGIGTVGLVALILIIGVISLVGWRVMSKDEKSPAPASTVTKNVPNNAQPVKSNTDETANWLVYEPTNKEYKIKFPDGWELYYSQDGGTALYGFTEKSITFSNGTKATVSLVGGRDWGAIPFLLVYSSTDNGLNNLTGTKQSSFTTNGGLPVDKYYNVVVVDPEGMGPAKGTKQYFYKIKKESKTIVIQHDISTGEADRSELIEKAVKTIEIN